MFNRTLVLCVFIISSMVMFLTGCEDKAAQAGDARLVNTGTVAKFDAPRSKTDLGIPHDVILDVDSQRLFIVLAYERDDVEGIFSNMSTDNVDFHIRANRQHMINLLATPREVPGQSMAMISSSDEALQEHAWYAYAFHWTTDWTHIAKSSNRIYFRPKPAEDQVAKAMEDLTDEERAAILKTYLKNGQQPPSNDSDS